MGRRRASRKGTHTTKNDAKKKTSNLDDGNETCVLEEPIKSSPSLPLSYDVTTGNNSDQTFFDFSLQKLSSSVQEKEKCEMPKKDSEYESADEAELNRLVNLECSKHLVGCEPIALISCFEKDTLSESIPELPCQTNSEERLSIEPAEEEHPDVLEKGYNLDFLEELEDPSFNPFVCRSRIRSSPPPTPTSDLPPLKPVAIKKKARTPIQSPSEDIPEKTITSRPDPEGSYLEGDSGPEKKERTPDNALGSIPVLSSVKPYLPEREEDTPSASTEKFSHLAPLRQEESQSLIVELSDGATEIPTQDSEVADLSQFENDELSILSEERSEEEIGRQEMSNKKTKRFSDPFQSRPRIRRSPNRMGKDSRRSLRQEDIDLSEKELSSLEDDSGIIMPPRSAPSPLANQSEAGPEIATGLTPSDLKLFLESENKSKKDPMTRRVEGSPRPRSPKRAEKPPVKEFEVNQRPPNEERSAPEGTCSPIPPKASEEHCIPEGFLSPVQVEELLKRQQREIEEKHRKNQKNEKGDFEEEEEALLKMVGQYKDMLSSLVSEREEEKKKMDAKIMEVEGERDQALEDLVNVEAAFSDVHRKYERTKQIVDTLRKNEEALKAVAIECENKLQKQEQKLIEFQRHAEDKIQQANEQYTLLRQTNEQEMTKMAALLKKAEMKIISLQDSLDRKGRENQELTQLCDELINKMGPSKKIH